ncbi:unnamed protein product [Moneuplotes crassus]|uniref:Cyclic nucleotide-binding domain-containing protein n=1 Tax=Euplotes crassus TaxID=5936 RepID=A0AAD1XZA1_EUPCR|nr:unnamed protein product [Moneuplotes crassus]
MELSKVSIKQKTNSNDTSTHPDNLNPCSTSDKDSEKEIAKAINEKEEEKAQIIKKKSSSRDGFPKLVQEDVNLGQVIRILKKEKIEDSDAEILQNYFQNDQLSDENKEENKKTQDSSAKPATNKFFADFMNENGVEALYDCYKSLKYSLIKKGQHVMRQGDYGDTYYIILKGKTSVLINMEVTYEWVCSPIDTTPGNIFKRNLKDFTNAFKEFIEKYDYILESKEKQRFLHEIKHYFPGVVKSRNSANSGREYYIEDIEKAKEIIKEGIEMQTFLKTHDFMRAKL